MILVELTEAEQRAANEWAAVMHQRGVSGVVTESRVAKHMTTLEIDELGASGELAVSKRTGAPVRWNQIDDGGIDIVIGKWECQVKTSATRIKVPQLYFTSLEKFTAPVAIYVQRIAHRHYQIWGCISRQRFVRTHYMKQFGEYGMHPCVNADELASLWMLCDPPEHREWWADYDRRDEQLKGKT